MSGLSAQSYPFVPKGEAAEVLQRMLDMWGHAASAQYCKMDPFEISTWAYCLLERVLGFFFVFGYVYRIKPWKGLF